MLRTLVSFAIFSPFVFVINADIFNPDDFFEILFIVYVLPSFISGFFFFAFSRLLFEKCKLVTSDTDCKKLGSQQRSDWGGQRQVDNLSDISYDSEDERADASDNIGENDSVEGAQKEKQGASTQTDSDSRDDDSANNNHTRDLGDFSYSAKQTTSSVFIRNDITAFKSKKDFALDTESTVTGR